MEFSVTDITKWTKQVLDFWFVTVGTSKWFTPSAELDRATKDMFVGLYRHLAGNSESHAQWLKTAEGSLALILALDQFPRNMFRGLRESFAADALALQAAKTAVARGHDLATPLEQRIFFYLPYEHSETLSDQDEAVRLVAERANVADYLRYAEAHRDIIRQFGRFPHRNEIFARPSTPDERAYLENGGHRFGVVASTGKPA